MGPFSDLLAVVPGWGILTYLLIGIGFGAVLEQSGFGDSRRLAAQFYFKDTRVLKVMFTAIIVAMLLIFLSSSLGLLEVRKLFVNPTYLLPQIVGGLIMGVGFIVGGFCPGTSLVAMATFKLDGLFFVLGALTGVYLFGESVSIFPNFFNETFWGVFTLPDLFGLPTGWVVLMVVIMALLMFAAAEIAETMIGRKEKWADVKRVLRAPYRRIGAALLLTASLVLILSGQPTLERRWGWLAEVEEGKLARREVHLHPGEVLEVMADSLLYSVILDVRSEHDYNLFHLQDAHLLPFDMLRGKNVVNWVMTMPQNTVVIVVANGATQAEEAYRLLKAHGVTNLYILDGGVNGWLDLFGIDVSIARAKIVETKAKDDGVDVLRYQFASAVGSSFWPANPNLDKSRLPVLEFKKKVKVTKKKAISGGCD